MEQQLRATLLFNDDLDTAQCTESHGQHRVEIHGEEKKQLKVANVNVFYSEPNQWDFTECKPAQNDWSF